MSGKKKVPASKLPECPSCQSAPLKKKWYEVPDTDYESDESIECVLCREDFEFYTECTGCEQTVCEHCISTAIKDARKNAPEVVNLSPASKRRSQGRYQLREGTPTPEAKPKSTKGDRKRTRDNSDDWVDKPSPKRRRRKSGNTTSTTTAAAATEDNNEAEEEQEQDVSDVEASEEASSQPSEGLYEVEKIVKHREIKPKAKPKGKRGRGRPPKTKYEFFVKWKKYPASQNSWEPEAHLGDVANLVKKYWQDQKGTKGQSIESSEAYSVGDEIDDIYESSEEDHEESDVDADDIKSVRELRRLLKKSQKEKKALEKENANFKKKMGKLEKSIDVAEDSE